VYSNLVKEIHTEMGFLFQNYQVSLPDPSAHYYQTPWLWPCWTKTCWRYNMVFEKSQQ